MFNTKCRRGFKKTPAERQYDLNRAAKKRRAVKGRLCEVCGRNDSQTVWSNNQTHCGRCHRNKWR